MRNSARAHSKPLPNQSHPFIPTWMYSSDKVVAILERGERLRFGRTGQAGKNLNFEFPIHKSIKSHSELNYTPKIYNFFANQPGKTGENYTLTAQYHL